MTAQPTESLGDLARMHGGVLPRHALLAHGVTAAQIVTHVRRGTWLAVGYGCYVAADVTNVHAARCVARLRGLSGDLVVSHASAGYLLQLPYVAEPSIPVFTLARSGAAEHRRHVHTSLLPPGHRVTAYGLVLTSGPRTLIDLLRTAEDMLEAQALADGALRAGVRIAAVEQVLAFCAGWPGIDQARAALAFAEPRCESPLESWVRILLRDGGFAAPTPQFSVRLGREFLGRVDFCFEQERVVIECDGQVKYRPETSWALRPEDALWQEKLREDKVRGAGYQVVRAYARDRDDHGADLCRRVRRAFELSARQRAVFP